MTTTDRPARRSIATRWAWLLLPTTLWGCDSPAQPGGGDLELTTALSAYRVAAGDPVTMTGRLTNVGDETMELTFGSACVIAPRVLATTTGADITPGFGCAQVVTAVELAAGESTTRTWVLVTSATPTPGASIGRGIHSVSASATTLDGRTIRSRPVPLTVE